MTQPPERRSYTQAERRAIVEQARKTAAKLLKQLEILASMDGAYDASGVVAAGQEGAGASGNSNEAKGG